MRAVTARWPRAAAFLVAGALIAGCGSASAPIVVASPTLDPATPIAIEDVDACALLTPAGAESVTGVPMTAGEAPVIPGTPRDRTLCEYLPTAEPTTSATTVQFFVLATEDSPFPTYAAGVRPFATHCVETSQPPMTTASGATAVCSYQMVEVAGALPGFVAYPGTSRDGSQPEAENDGGLQLYWWAGGLTFLLMTSVLEGPPTAAAIRGVADQIARALA